MPKTYKQKKMHEGFDMTFLATEYDDQKPIMASTNTSTMTMALDGENEKERSNNSTRNLESAGADRAEWKPSLHELLIMFSLALISFMVSLDASIIITSLSSIVTDLHGTATEAFWIGTSYLLTCAVTMPFIAALSDIFGRSRCLLTSIASFATGTIVCCTSHKLSILLVGRCIQGIGGGGIVIISLVIFTDIVPLRFRSKYYGILQGGWAIGVCIGPVLGGIFVEHTTWRWVFYIMLPFCFVGFATLPWVLTLKPKSETFQEKLIRVDWLGGFLFISSSTSLLIAISWGGTQEPWSSFRTIVPLVLGVLGLSLTAVWETYGAREPFLRRSLFHCPSAFAAYFGAFVQGFLLYGCFYYGPLYFLSVRNASPIQSGVNIFPTTTSLIPASIVVGIVVTRINHFRWAIWSGWLIITMATGTMIIWDKTTPRAGWVTTMVFVGIGHGLVLNAQNFATQAIALPKDEAAAAAMYAFLRSFGMAVGVGIGGSVFQNVMMAKLTEFGLPVDIARNAEAYIKTLWDTSTDSLLHQKVLESYVFGLRGTFGLFCGIAGLAGIASCFIGHFDLNKELDSEHRLGKDRFSKAFGQIEEV